MTEIMDEPFPDAKFHPLVRSFEVLANFAIERPEIGGDDRVEVVAETARVPKARFTRRFIVAVI
jgi:hypothetical protein